MKIGIVMPLADKLGGSETLLMRLLEAHKASMGVEYTLAFLEDGPMVAEASALGYSARVFPVGQLREGRKYVRALFGLRKWLREEKVQGVLSWMAKAQLYAGPAARSVGVPAIWWQHGFPEGNRLDNLIAMLPAHSILCCSRSVQQEMKRLKPSLASHPIYPAVDLRQFDLNQLPSPMEARRQLGLPEDKIIVGIVARLQRWKGVHVVIDAAARLASAHPDLFVVVVGGKHALEPEYAEEIVQRPEALGIQDRVCFAGRQSNVPMWMQAMDVVVHASTGAEPFGMVIIEGMALGKVVIATRAGGPLEIIEEGVDGLLAEPDNAEELASAIELALKPGPEMDALRAAARRKASAFGAERFAAELAHYVQTAFCK